MYLPNLKLLDGYEYHHFFEIDNPTLNGLKFISINCPNLEIFRMKTYRKINLSDAQYLIDNLSKLKIYVY